MLDKNLVAEILDEALSTGGDWAEVFVEKRNDEILTLQDRQVKNISSAIGLGIGIRVLKEKFQVYAYTNVMDRENLLKTARKAAQGIKGKAAGHKFDLVNYELENRHKVLVDPQNINKNEKINMLREVAEAAYTYSPLIMQVTAGMDNSRRDILVANSDGLWAEDTQIRTKMSLMAMAERETIKESAFDALANLGGMEFYEKLPNGLQGWTKTVAERAVANTYAVDCPCGKMPVIIDNAFGGVIFHEACGHSLEASFVSKGISEFCGKMGQQVASPLVSAYDDGLPANLWGSINIDDEGMPSQKRVLIENGILKGYLVDKFNGRKMGIASTASGRRENYTFIPTSRMSNTYIGNGKSSKEEIIANTENGLFATKISGGSVNTTTGDFNFSVNEAFMVRNGKIAERVKGAKLIGKGIDVLNKIDMVGNNLELASGTCGAASGSVPVTVGQPTIRVSEMIVGGKE